jgi:regulator of PEP synthase PpsR (kinase-PPPase family)
VSSAGPGDGLSGTPIEVHLISDSTGDTAARVARAAQTQFSGHRTAMIRHPRVTTLEGLELAYERVGRGPVAIFFTLVDRALRVALVDWCTRDGVAFCDLLGPPLEALALAAGHEADFAVGRPVGLDPDYFKRVAAMEFAVRHDDGQAGVELEKAEIVLVGVSRSGKTPVSMYLGYLGWATANVPLVHGIPPPPTLFEVDRYKIVGLTIEPERLQAIRGRRLRSIQRMRRGDNAYAEMNQILEELEGAAVVHRRLGCPVLDITETAVEEAAQRVIELVEARRPA